MLNLQTATVSRTATGITIDDSASPWLIHVAAAPDPTRITSLTVEAKPGTATPVTNWRLAHLPTQQLLHVAALHILDDSHPNEAYYRALATPLPPRVRTRSPEHWSNVRTVAAWADDTGRPGGAQRAIADLWAVTYEPTARRWLKQARYTRTVETPDL